MAADYAVGGVFIVPEHYNAIVDIGSSGGVLAARFLRTQSGWHCQAVGLKSWSWGAWAPLGEPKDALRRFADRWLGPGQGLFCSVLAIARDDATSPTPERPVALPAAPRRPGPIARTDPPGREDPRPARGREVGRGLDPATMRWRFDVN